MYYFHTKRKPHIFIKHVAFLLFLCVLYSFSTHKKCAAETTEYYQVYVNKGDSGNTIADLLLTSYDTSKYTGLQINIPAGEYYMYDSLYIPSNVILKADPNAHFYKMSGYGAMIEGKIELDEKGNDVCKNIIIDGGIWDSSPIAGHFKGTETFRFIHADNITICNADLCNMPTGGHLLVLAGVSNATVKDCSFHGYGDGKPYSNQKEAIQLDIAHDSNLVPTIQSVQWDDRACNNITIDHCHIYDYSRAIGSHTSVNGIYHSDITISNNTMEDINEVALKLFNYKNCTVSNNLIKNSATGIYVYTGFKEKTSSSGMFFPPLNGIVNAEPSNHHIVIKNNTITKSKQFNKGYGDGIRVSGDTKHPIKGVTISNNKIKNTKRYGIFVSNCPKTTLKKNQIENVTKDGILLNADSNQSKIINNKVAKTNNYGIWVSEKTKNIHVKHNTVTACKKYGIFIYKTINRTILYNKIIQKTNISALHVGECTRTKISKNTIVGGKRGYEIWVTGTTNASVSQNTIR